MLGLSTKTTIPGPAIFQTLSGGKNIPGTVFELHGTDPLTGQDQMSSKINGPDGLRLKVLGRSVIPTLIIPQIGVAISPATEVMVRFLPVSHFIDKSTISVLGLGIKHILTEDIFGPDDKIYQVLPPFDIAGYAGFTSENFSYKVTIIPSFIDKTNSGNTATNYSNQRIRIQSRDFTAGVLISRKFSVLIPHLGIAWSAANTEIAVLGTYPVKSTMAPGYTTIINLNNPFLVSGSHWGLNANMGLAVDLAFFRINCDFILSRYKRVNMGISFFL